MMMPDKNLKEIDKKIVKDVIHKANILNSLDSLRKDIADLKNIHYDFAGNSTDFTVFSLVIDEGYSHDKKIKLYNREIISELLVSLVIDKVNEYDSLIKEFNND